MEIISTKVYECNYCMDPNRKNIYIKPKKTTPPRSTKAEDKKQKEREKRKNKIVKL